MDDAFVAAMSLARHCELTSDPVASRERARASRMKERSKNSQIARLGVQTSKRARARSRRRFGAPVRVSSDALSEILHRVQVIDR
jgi:hypothetical protein